MDRLRKRIERLMAAFGARIKEYEADVAKGKEEQAGKMKRAMKFVDDWGKGVSWEE